MRGSSPDLRAGDTIFYATSTQGSGIFFSFKYLGLTTLTDFPVHRGRHALARQGLKAGNGGQVQPAFFGFAPDALGDGVLGFAFECRRCAQQGGFVPLAGARFGSRRIRLR